MIACEKAIAVLEACRRHKHLMATAESCTGGMIIASITDIAGSSDVVECGFITYSNEAKQQLIGVSADLLLNHGAVSHHVACAMAEGALLHSRATLAVAVTGIAGPGGGSDLKPVGLVHMAVAEKDRATGKITTLHHEARFGDIGREQIRLATVHKALDLILQRLEEA